jgi:hypothetical protein
MVEAAGIEPESEVHRIQTFDCQIIRRIIPAVLDDPQEKFEKLLSQLCKSSSVVTPPPNSRSSGIKSRFDKLRI